MKNSRVTELLAAFADEQISPDELAELESLLLASPSARQQFWSEMALHGLTREAAELKWAGQPAPAPRPNWLTAIAEYFQPRWRLAWASGLAVALICVGFFVMWQRPT